MEVGYRITVQWSGADSAFVAAVPDLPGCLPTGRRGKPQSATSKKLSSSGSRPLKSSGIRSRHPGAKAQRPPEPVMPPISGNNSCRPFTS